MNTCMLYRPQRSSTWRFTRDALVSLAFQQRRACQRGQHRHVSLVLYARSVPLGIGIKCAEYTTVSILLASGMHTQSLHLRELIRKREREVGLDTCWCNVNFNRFA